MLDKKIKIKSNEDRVFFWPFYDQKLREASFIFELAENSALTNIFLFSAAGNAHFNINIAVKHLGRNSSSKTVIRAICKDRAAVSVIAKAEASKEAVKANVWLESRALLFGESQCRFDPRLEILTSEVERAGHAAAVSRISEEELFYLASRGLNQMDAEKLKIEGFFLAPFLQMGFNFRKARKIIKPLLV